MSHHIDNVAGELLRHAVPRWARALAHVEVELRNHDEPTIAEVLGVPEEEAFDRVCLLIEDVRTSCDLVMQAEVKDKQALEDRVRNLEAERAAAFAALADLGLEDCDCSLTDAIHELFARSR